MIDTRVSRMFCVARVFALISIVSAHIALPGTLAGLLFDRIGSVGVISFLIMSGYFYNTNKYPQIAYMLLDKLKTIVIPWLFMGTIVYLYNTILGGNSINLISFFKWIIGNGTYFYYMTVLMVCYILFFIKRNFVVYSAIILNLFSLFFTITGIINPIINFLSITNYLNVFNWLGFFALGMLIKKSDPDKLYDFFAKNKYFILLIYNSALITLLFYSNVKTGYFSYLGVFYEFLGTAAIFSLSTFEFLNFKIMHEISNCSFSIYLVHIMFIALVDDFLKLHFVTRLFMPVVIVLLAFIIFNVADWICKKIHLHNLFVTFTGLRKRKLNKNSLTIQ